MSPLIIRLINRMTVNFSGRHVTAPARVIGTVLVAMELIVFFICEGQVQMKPTMKIKLNVSPSINISGMDAGLQGSLTEEVLHLNRLIAERTGKSDYVDLSHGSGFSVLRDERTGAPDSVSGSGFSISAFENITVLLSYTIPHSDSNNDASYAVRMLCGYLNDGTTYFRRANVTDKNSIQFQLRNSNVLKRSMKFNNAKFVAYVFFLVNLRKEETKRGRSKPISTVTVEFL
jgi:hypothetical protein